MDFSAIIKEKLLSLISEIDQYHWLFTRNPEKDFSRIKKWSFGEIVSEPAEARNLWKNVTKFCMFQNGSPGSGKKWRRR